MLPAAGMAFLLSLILFAVMYSVIRVGHHGAEKLEVLQTIDFVRLINCAPGQRRWTPR